MLHHGRGLERYGWMPGGVSPPFCGGAIVTSRGGGSLASGVRGKACEHMLLLYGDLVAILSLVAIIEGWGWGDGVN